MGSTWINRGVHYPFLMVPRTDMVIPTRHLAVASLGGPQSHGFQYSNDPMLDVLRLPTPW